MNKTLLIYTHKHDTRNRVHIITNAESYGALCGRYVGNSDQVWNSVGYVTDSFNGHRVCQNCYTYAFRLIHAQGDSK